MKTYIDGIYYDLNESSQTAKIIPHYDEDWILDNRYNDNIIIPPKVYYSELIFDVVEISAHAFDNLLSNLLLSLVFCTYLL